jgi:hypothetical protein
VLGSLSEVKSQTADEITRVLTSASYCLFDGGEKPLDKATIVNRELEHDRNTRGKGINPAFTG